MHDKLHIFDLDGVLVNTHNIHTNALRRAVQELISEKASREECLDASDGVKTSDKLKNLALHYSFDSILVDNRKKELTLIELKNLPKSTLRESLLNLKSDSYIALASNSRSIFVNEILKTIDLDNVFDYVICGDEVKEGKPNPEMFLTVIDHFKVLPSNTVVYEDSYAGVFAAIKAKTRVVRINPRILLQEYQYV